MADPHDGWTPEVQTEIQPGDPTRTERPELNALMEAYAIARAGREAAGDVEKERRRIEDEAERQLFDAMERLQLRSARHDTYGLFTLNDMANAVVTDEGELRKWALEEMPELLLANRARLGKVVRDTLREGGVMPPGVDVAFKRGINWRRGPG